MQKRNFRTIHGIWVLMNLALVLRPTYYAVIGDAPGFRDAISMAIAGVFLLSFPLSIAALLLALVFITLLEINRVNMPEVQYYTLLVMFAFGCVQWFWIFPRFFTKAKEIEVLDLPDGRLAAATRELRQGWGNSADARSPFERVIKDYETTGQQSPVSQ